MRLPYFRVSGQSMAEIQQIPVSEKQREFHNLKLGHVTLPLDPIWSNLHILVKTLCRLWGTKLWSRISSGDIKGEGLKIQK